MSRQAPPAPAREAADAPQSRTYLISGHKAVFGNEPGSVVDLTLTEGQAKALQASGLIEPHAAAPSEVEEEVVNTDDQSSNQ